MTTTVTEPAEPRPAPRWPRTLAYFLTSFVGALTPAALAMHSRMAAAGPEPTSSAAQEAHWLGMLLFPVFIIGFWALYIPARRHPKLLQALLVLTTALAATTLGWALSTLA